MNKRIEFIDALKCFAIFCVLWGHSLQYLRGTYDFFHNPVFEFIYSFHMPLFFMISGFFFDSSLKQNLKDFALKKGKQLLLPCLTWAIIFALPTVATKIYHGAQVDFALIKSIVRPPFWFLKDLFISYALTYLSIKVLKKQWLACALSLLFVSFAPFCGAQRFLLPVFWIGICIKCRYRLILKYSKQILAIFTVLFSVCLMFWDGNYTMYVSPFRPFNIKELKFDFTNSDILLFRLAVGIAGSLFWFILFQKIYRNSRFFSVLSAAGTYTTGIYILQVIILERLINRLIDFPDVNIYVYNFLLTPLTALSTGIICIFAIRLISGSKTASTVLFGK